MRTPFGIVVDGSFLDGPGVPGTGRQYEQDVERVLYDIATTRTGAVVLGFFSARALRQPLWVRPTGAPVANAFTLSRSDRNAAPLGEAIRDANGQVVRDDPRTPQVEGGIGTGIGSSVDIVYRPNVFPASGSHGPGSRPDEVLLHELMHAVRRIRGHFLQLTAPAPFNNQEEFFAVLVANIYASERGRLLRGDHTMHREQGQLVSRGLSLRDAMAPDVSTAHATRFRDLLERFVQQEGQLARDLAGVGALYNPLREHLATPAERAARLRRLNPFNGLAPAAP